MKIIHDPMLLRNNIKQFKTTGQEIVFIPTMGNLHDGHIALIKEGQKVASITVVSIFVNPMQFNNQADLKNYPRTLEADYKKLEAAGVDIVFVPSAEVIYPHGLETQTYIEVPVLSDVLEGKLRPGHFRGMSTIVTKLFNLVQPDHACFGEKDFQQLAIIKQMVKDMGMPINIIAVPIIRAENGLALSSRNSKLNAEQMQIAPLLARVMQQLAGDITQQTLNYDDSINKATQALEQGGFKPDAIDIVDAQTLQAVHSETKQAVILMAAYLGNTRLIDNKVVNL
ncbi:pantoate--beta-alanine ligase [Psychromonas sp. CNPT3]|uniref:pantoate--beta-alanine ligase n=1 Tax=Psychromonas sp. CNPT3 TaxID=314282 RepID=UPI00006E78CC|nr:pantoate--beta-alanine ligase [Psychromonas sp. CNPT3]AGH82103.1 pantoate--beta-alanine ligase [Psychromonas sp. CNPT3]